MQVVNTKTEEVYLTVAIKSAREHRVSAEWRENMQACEQGLAGLRERDETHFLLLTPAKFILNQLSIQAPRSAGDMRRMQLFKKEYILQRSFKFNTAALIEFMEDMLSLLLKISL